MTLCVTQDFKTVTSNMEFENSELKNVDCQEVYFNLSDKYFLVVLILNILRFVYNCCLSCLVFL